MEFIYVTTKDDKIVKPFISLGRVQVLIVVKMAQ